MRGHEHRAESNGQISHPYLNVGCGNRFHPEWVNIDVEPSAPAVKDHDVKKGLPFPDASFQVVYHSHVLEHLTPEEGMQLLKECHRVLRPQGTLRVAVPDLEQIAALYLEALRRARNGEDGWDENYDWMMIELYDQTVRETSGGRHGSYLSREHIPNREFVVMRHGREAEDSIRGSETIRRLVAAGQYDRAPAPRAAGTHRGDGWKRALLRRIRETVVRQLLQWEYGALTLGRFRREAARFICGCTIATRWVEPSSRPGSSSRRARMR